MKDSQDPIDRIFLIFLLVILFFVCIGSCEFRIEINSKADIAEIDSYARTNH